MSVFPMLVISFFVLSIINFSNSAVTKQLIDQIPENCQKARIINVQNTEGSAQTGITVKIEFSLSDVTPKNPSCGDVYIYDPLTGTYVMYFKEKCGVFFFQVDFNVGENIKEFYLYYNCQTVNPAKYYPNDFNWYLLSRVPCPSPWTRYTTNDNKFIKIGNTFNDVSPSLSTHTHDFLEGPTQTTDAGYWSDSWPDQVLTGYWSGTSHSHTVGAFSTGNNNEDILPPWRSYYICYHNELNIFQDAVLLGNPLFGPHSPSQYDYGNDGIDGYVMGMNSYGATGGRPDHTHTFSATLSGQSGENVWDDEDSGGQFCALDSHSHTLTTKDTLAGINYISYHIFDAWMSLTGNNSYPAPGGAYLLSDSNTIPPLGYDRYTTANGKHVAISNSQTWPSHQYITQHRHDTNVLTSTVSSGVTAEKAKGGGSSKRLRDNHQHTFDLTSEFTVNPDVPRIRFTMYTRKTLSQYIITWYSMSEYDVPYTREVPDCFPTCKNHGTCYGFNPSLCACIESNWTGTTCETPVCAENICGSHGTCSAPHFCTCHPKWQTPAAFMKNQTQCNSSIVDNTGPRGPPNLAPLIITLTSISIVALVAVVVAGIGIVIAYYVYVTLQKRRKNALGVIKDLTERKELLQQKEEETRLFLLKKSELKEELDKLKEEEERLKKIRVFVNEVEPIKVENKVKICTYKHYNVYSCSYNSSDVLVREFSSKIFSSSMFNAYKFFCNEIKLKSFNHPNVLKNISYYKYGVISEYCPYTIKQYIDKGNKLSFNEAVRILFEISSGGLFLHKKKICMKNLNIDNIYLEEKTKKPKIDFGLHKFLNENYRNLYYSAPEIVIPMVKKSDEEEEEEEDDEEEVQEEEKIQYRADIFSFGMIMFCMLKHTSDPYNINAKSTSGIAMKIAKNEGYRPMLGRNIEQYPNWYVNLMNQCLRHNPNERPSFTRIQMIIKTIMQQDDEVEEEQEVEEEKEDEKTEK